MPDNKEPAWKCKIKAGNLMSRVHKHAKGEIEMTATQLKAAEMYLRKTIPDLARTELVGDKNAPLQVQWPIPRSKLDE